MNPAVSATLLACDRAVLQCAPEQDTEKVRQLWKSLVDMPFSQSKFIKFQKGMRRRIESLRPKAEESLELAVDTMMEERVDSFFRVEQGLEEVIKSLLQIEEEIGEVRDLSGAMRLESRLEFVEDRWDDFDSEIRERPRRRRKKISLADMLKAAGGGGGDLSQGSSGINNAMDAYAAMGVEFGSDADDVGQVDAVGKPNGWATSALSL